MTENAGAEPVITGTGVVSPIGCSTEDFWSSLSSGRSGIATITGFDASELTTRFAGEVAAADYYPAVPAKVSRRVDRFVVMTLAAGGEALDQSGLTGSRPAGLRIGVCLGTSSGPLETNYRADLAFAQSGQSGLRRALPYVSTASSVSSAVAELALQHQLDGPSLTVSGECASGANAIGTAAAMIRSGAADVMVCGGVDATVNARSMAIMSIVGALSTNNTNPQGACRPFDTDRDGFVMGEGAAIIVLESAASAAARGATVLGRVLGYGAATDTYHATAPDPSGQGAITSIRRSLDDAQVSPAQIGFVNAHATGTQLNDPIELAALRVVLGQRAAEVPVYGIKPLTGHMIAAAGAAEAIAVLLSLKHRVLPPTSNCDDPIDPEMDIVRTGPRQIDTDCALSTSFGFGGQCAALVLGSASWPAAHPTREVHHA